MTFDWNVAGGEAALMEHLAFEQTRSRVVAYPVVNTAAGAQAPSQAVTPSTLAAMSQQNRQSLSLSPASSWLPLDMTPAATTSASVGSSSPEEQQAPSPGYHSSASSPLQHQPSPFQTAAHPNPSLITDWPLPQQHVHHAHQAHHELSHFIQDSSLITFNPLMPTFQPAPLEYMPSTTAGLPGPMPAFGNMSPVDDATHSPAHPAAASAMPWGMGMANWQDFEAAIAAHPDGLPRVGSLGSHSPTGTYLEVLSLNSGSDNGWTGVDVFPNYDQYQQTQQQQSHNAAIFNPGQTLHLRTNSDSSHSDGNSLESSGYEEIPFPYSPFSPNSDTCLDSAGGHRRYCPGDQAHSRQHASPELISPVGSVGPITIKAAPASGKGTSGSGSGSASSSPPNRRNSGGPRKSPIAKATKVVSRRSPIGDSKKDGAGEKKVGRRRGPLRPDQRKQASEIRKLRACLRCKFLKKTCDTGEPCNGCQPAHARLWQVPCTRIDIKDIGFFMKDWKADYERHLGRGVSVFNVKGFAPKETLMWITHGYGFCLPVTVREVYVADESCFQLDWVESSLMDHQEPINFEIRTERLDVGHEGVNMEALNEYLDKHVDEGFERFIDDHFEGTPFITEIFKTAYRFYQKSRLPVIRKALKLVVAYNLTLHITMIESSPVEQQIDGQVDDEDSKYFGKTVAPVMINFQIKCAMADMWRDLQKDILEELSSLYSSVYSGERLKNWPTIFMLASILLAVWEEMQFDCHYRVPDPVAVNKFCTDMEQTPVGVIVGLFHAISQKLPSFTEWDTRRHGQLLQNNPAVCEAMTEVRQHVIKHEAYLRTRQDCKFDRYDFDSLSNKFLSKLVIRAN